jgi:hypothetical protein
MTLVALFSTVAVLFKLSGSAALIVFGFWAVVFSLIVMGEMKRD